MNMGKIIGIDLGTSNSAAAVLEGGKPRIIPSAEGNTVYGKAFPSYVAFSKDGKLLVGEPAKRQSVTNLIEQLQKQKEKWVLATNTKLMEKNTLLKQISAFILQKNKKRCRKFFRRKN